MNAIPIMLLVVPVLVSGYVFLSMAALTGAAILAWDGAHLFMGSSSSPRVVHQRQYVTSMARALTWLISVLVLSLGVAAALVMATIATIGPP